MFATLEENTLRKLERDLISVKILSFPALCSLEMEGKGLRLQGRGKKREKTKEERKREALL